MSIILTEVREKNATVEISAENLSAILRGETLSADRARSAVASGVSVVKLLAEGDQVASAEALLKSVINGVAKTLEHTGKDDGEFAARCAVGCTCNASHIGADYHAESLGLFVESLGHVGVVAGRKTGRSLLTSLRMAQAMAKCLRLAKEFSVITIRH